jgi:hypothetical protein
VLLYINLKFDAGQETGDRRQETGDRRQQLGSTREDSRRKIVTVDRSILEK